MEEIIEILVLEYLPHVSVLLCVDNDQKKLFVDPFSTGLIEEDTARELVGKGFNLVVWDRFNGVYTGSIKPRAAHVS